MAYRGASLNIPAFTKEKSQLPSTDVESARRLANVRTHVERVIGSVRQKFQVLSATMPLPTQYTRSRVGSPILLDSIVRVCCALHNACDIIVLTCHLKSSEPYRTPINVFFYARASLYYNCLLYVFIIFLPYILYVQ